MWNSVFQNATCYWPGTEGQQHLLKLHSVIRFQMLCEKAFMILRQRSKFLITLFMMMMNTGIPEVSCLSDIEYLKEMLVPDITDTEALDHFRSKFREALKNSWKTSVNWMIHNIHCNN